MNLQPFFLKQNNNNFVSRAENNELHPLSFLQAINFLNSEVYSNKILL